MSYGAIPAAPAVDVTAAARWRRCALVHVLQIPLLALAWFGAWPLALWTAALIGSLICCAGTDSTRGPGARLARWLNRLLVLDAVAWISVALILGMPS